MYLIRILWDKTPKYSCDSQWWKSRYRLAASEAENISFSTRTHRQTITQLYCHCRQAFKTANIKLQLSISSFELWNDEHLLKEWKEKNIPSNSRDNSRTRKKNRPKVKQVPNTSLHRKMDVEIVHCDSADAAIWFENNKATQSIACCLTHKPRIIREI